MKRTRSHGFILPSVLLVGLGVLIIGLALIQTSSSIRSSIDNSYYIRVASEAAEAGSDYATYCLKANNYTQTWGPSAGRPNLTQSTDCTGAPVNNLTSLTPVNGVSSTFSVGNVTRSSDGSYVISVSSEVDRLTANNSVVQKYTNNSLKAVGADAIRFSTVTFGYYAAYSPVGQEGAFFAVLGSDGKYRVVGSNTVGQLGNGTTQDTVSPEVYTPPTSSPAVAAFSNFVSQGYNLFVLTQDGSVYGAGLGDSGQLGNGATNRVNSTPQLFQLPQGEVATYVAPKGDATFVLTQSHNLYAAGSCSAGQLGINNGSCGNVSTPTRVALPTVNTSDLNTLPTNDIVLDANTVFVRMQGGRVYGWGNNSHGQLGISNRSGSSNIPIQVGTFGNPGQPKATQLAFDGDTIYIVASDGNVYAVGRNDFGEKGTAPSGDDYHVVRVPIPASAGAVVQAATDQWSGLFRTASGQVWGAGLDMVGELGNGSTSGSTRQPVQFILPSGVKAVNLYNASTGTADGGKFNNTFVVGDDGKVYGSGANSYGQLGLGYNSTSESTPKAMQVFDGFNVRAGSVITGLGTTIILSTDNIYYTVGYNAYGQLGNGTTTNTNTPAAAEYLRPIPAFIF